LKGGRFIPEKLQSDDALDLLDDDDELESGTIEKDPQLQRSFHAIRSPHTATAEPLANVPSITFQHTLPAKPATGHAVPAPPKEKAAPQPDPAAADDNNHKPLTHRRKHPLDLLPKSEFKMQEWKRIYSKLHTRGPAGSIEWFYNKFDKEGFSIWRCDFKHPEELTLPFMSSNLIAGFYQRLSPSRKYLFGSLGILGNSNNSLVSGVFICRGKDYKPVLEVAPDWESYDIKPINLEDKAEKAFFEAALAWDLSIKGKKWTGGKVFQ